MYILDNHEITEPKIQAPFINLKVTFISFQDYLLNQEYRLMI
jgi:hypothetical protein